MNIYSHPQLYDAIHHNYKSDIALVQSIAKNISGSVLELASGTGRLAEAIIKLGLNYTGLELSEPFINLAKKKYRHNADFVQGNMQNFKLLEAVGESKLPVLLKRGLSATLEELLLASEYILARGNENVILCERGIRTYETATRNTFDINAIPYLKMNTHLPVIADPSHATGDSKLVEPIALAAIAAGADGLLIEIHPRPEEALCDGPQALTPDEFDDLTKKVSSIATVVGRTFN